jgi:hypothetical protein
MNCLYEIIAGAYMNARNRVLPPYHDDLGDAEENLESCRASLAFRERDLAAQATRLAAQAVSKKASGDLGAAKFALLERKRVVVRLEKVRNGIALLDKQLDALKSSELDKELMNSLKLSSQAMRKAGIGQGLEEAETVMNELDDQIREASELTSVLATPLVNSAGLEEEDLDVDEELGLISKEAAQPAAVLAVSLPSPAVEPAPPMEADPEPARRERVVPQVHSRMDFF